MIPKASDIKIRLTLRDKVTKAILDTDDYVGIVVYIYELIRECNKRVIQKFSKVSNPDFEELEIVSPTTSGQVIAYVNRELTGDLKSKTFFAEVKIAATDSEALNGKFVTIATGILVSLAEESVAPDEDVPVS